MTGKSKPWRVVPIAASGPLEPSDHRSRVKAYQQALDLLGGRQTADNPEVTRVDIHFWFADGQRWEEWEQGVLTGGHTGPSRFHATPAEIDAFLRQHLAEDTLLRYQQAIGNRAAEEAAKDIRCAIAVRSLDPTRLALSAKEAADYIDPVRGGGHWPSALVSFGAQRCPTCDGTGGDHQIGCQP
jgi:hypothetical protein